MVLGQVGEDAAAEGDSGHAAELERVRGDLHRAGHVAAVEHAPERVLEVDRLGGRALYLLLDAGDDSFDGAEQAAPVPGRLEQVPDQEGRRRLAVGAGDADQLHLRRRIAIEAGRRWAHRSAHVVDHHLGHTEPERALADERRRAARDRVGSEVVAVRAESGHAKKERPRGDALARVGESRDLDLGRPITHQVPQGHGAVAGYRGVWTHFLAEAADTDPVSGNVLSALALLAERRFQSFSEAADGVLDLLEGELPPGSLLLGQVDSEEGELRLIDVRGDAQATIQAGSTLPLARHLNGDGGGLLDPAALEQLAVRSYLAMPLQTHGSGAITLCALSPTTDLFTRSHLDLLAVAGRLLTYEWESVKWRADLRRLNERLRDPERTDALTGLLNRTAFIEALEHEWRLAERGSAESYLLACRLANLSDVADRHGAGLGELLLRDSADVMEEAIRRTDHAGRLGDDVLGAVLVGCKGPEGADAFFERFKHALARVTSERPATLDVAYAVLALGKSESPEDALRDIEKAARKARVAVPGGTS